MPNLQRQAKAWTPYRDTREYLSSASVTGGCRFHCRQSGLTLIFADRISVDERELAFPTTKRVQRSKFKVRVGSSGVLDGPYLFSGFNSSTPFGAHASTIAFESFAMVRSPSLSGLQRWSEFS